MVQVGDTVIYRTTQEDRVIMSMQNCNTQKELPAIVTAKRSEDCVNLKIILDGPIPFLWKTSVNRKNQYSADEGFYWYEKAIVTVISAVANPNLAFIDNGNIVNAADTVADMRTTYGIGSATAKLGSRE